MRSGGTGDWMQEGAQSSDLQRQHAVHMEKHPGMATDLTDWLATSPPQLTDKPKAWKSIHEGQEQTPVFGPGTGAAGQDPGHVTYTFKCPKCANRRRHATVTRREDNLTPILERLEQHGIDRITVDGLAQAAGRFDKETDHE
ncbi:hypothetical protein ACFFX0_24115 [Citricoccus parietis]|uniref:Uncharacterized protein n=1 Tax=Citricoccus parietis TaxID=592307 RepID=A0ABV5G595_9MICC